MNLQQIKESAKKEFDKKYPSKEYEQVDDEGNETGVMVLTLEDFAPNPIELKDFIDSIITKAFTEGQDLGEKEVNKRAEKYITEVLGYTCPDFRI